MEKLRKASNGAGSIFQPETKGVLLSSNDERMAAAVWHTYAIDIIRNSGFEFHSKALSRNIVLKLWRPHAISIA
jgi:hypothetical protein